MLQQKQNPIPILEFVDNLSVEKININEKHLRKKIVYLPIGFIGKTGETHPCLSGFRKSCVSDSCKLLSLPGSRVFTRGNIRF